MTKEGVIEHVGYISDVNSNGVDVKIQTMAACGSCMAKNHCNLTGAEERIIHIQMYNSNFKVGDKVMVSTRLSTGNKAVFLAYILPFVVLIAGLLIGIYITGNEPYTALFAIVLLILYYTGLSVFKSKISKSVQFNIYPTE